MKISLPGDRKGIMLGILRTYGPVLFSGTGASDSCTINVRTWNYNAYATYRYDPAFDSDPVIIMYPIEDLFKKVYFRVYDMVNKIEAKDA